MIFEKNIGGMGAERVLRCDYWVVLCNFG
jgi:hypothetical protein